MDQEQVKKICRSCGEDVTHKKRHKNRNGKYTCSKCRKAEKRWPRRMLMGLTKGKFLLVVLYVILAAAACKIFWTILDYVNQLSE